MIPTAIGLATDRKGKPSGDAMQEWLHDHGMTPYMPHLRHQSSYNIGMMTDVVGRTLARTIGNGGYGLTREAIAEMQRFGLQMLFAYGGYYYSTRPDTLGWIGADGVRRNQDSLTVEQMAEYLRIAYEWQQREGIEGYIFCDELPHPATTGDVGRWGWSPQVEARGVRFLTAAQAAGFVVALACPPAAAVEYWAGVGENPTADGKPRFTPDIWMTTDPVTDAELAAKHQRCDKLFAGKPVWLYNAVNANGLARRIASFNPDGGGGYLHWDGQRAKPPMFTATGAATDFAEALVSELEKVSDQPPAPPVTVEQQIVDLRAEVVALTARVAALETTADDGPQTSGTAALFYSSAVADWRRELDRLAEYGRVVINAEMATATFNSAGEPYADGRMPLRYLQDQGVDVWLYVSPWWIWTASALGGPGESLRQAQLETAEVTAAWLLDWQGKRVTAYSGKMTVVDARNESYRSWLGLRLLQLPHEQLFLDQAWPHQQGYHGTMISDAAWVEAAGSLYRTLRAGGKQLMLNGGWEWDGQWPVVSGQWSETRWPLREMCDGVAIEVPGGFRQDGKWWSVWEEQRRDLSRLEAVAAAWKGMGKEVMVVAKGTDRVYWREAAARMGVWWTCQQNYVTVPEADNE